MSFCMNTLRVSVADTGGGIAHCLKDLFTISPPIRVFVVVIMPLLSGPWITITGPHLSTTSCFLASLHHLHAHINTEVKVQRFLNKWQMLYRNA